MPTRREMTRFSGNAWRLECGSIVSVSTPVPGFADRGFTGGAKGHGGGVLSSTPPPPFPGAIRFRPLKIVDNVVIFDSSGKNTES